MIINGFVHINGFSGSALGYIAILSKTYRLILAYTICVLMCVINNRVPLTLSLYFTGGLFVFL